MADDPKSYIGIMVSSTFTDLEEHRQEVIDAIAKLGFHPLVMEHSGANAAEDVIGTSLAMVRDCSAYVLIISHKYGQTPVDPIRNPDGLSITELEFNEAVRLGRPRLLFIMGDDHGVKAAHVETDASKIAKRDAFKERAKGMCPASGGSSVNCVYEVFDSKEALAKSAAIALGRHGIWLANKASNQTEPSKIDPGEFAKLLEAVRAEAEAKNISSKAFLALASKVAEHVPDTETAISELNNALDEYLRIRSKAGIRNNFADEIDQAINRVQAKIAANDFDGALAQGEAEYQLLEEREAELSAAKIRLAETNIAAARIAYDATTMARWITAKLALEQGLKQVTADQLRAAQDLWYEKSRKYGSHLDMDVAIALARLSIRASDDPILIASGQNDLGIALKVQGERLREETGLRLLSESVTAFRAALEVYTRDAKPVEWAITQNNLGSVLRVQGSRLGGEAGQILLGEAVTAYRAALEVHTRNAMPVDWAMTQNNLGIALRAQSVGQDGETGLLLLNQAITAYRAALEVRTRARMPEQWAMTQNNLGAALRVQSARQGGEAGLCLLSEAVTVYRAALEVRTRDEMPVQWAITTENVGIALYAMARLDVVQRCALLREARAEVASSLEVFTPDHLPFNWKKASALLAEIDAHIAKDC